MRPLVDGGIELVSRSEVRENGVRYAVTCAVREVIPRRLLSAREPWQHYVCVMSSDDPNVVGSVSPADLPWVKIAEALPDAVILLDSEACLRWGNRAAEQLFGRTNEETVGHSALEFIHEDDIELVLRSLTSVQEKEVGTLIELRVLTASGWRLVEVIGRQTPEIGEDNLLFCIRDVTDRRRFEVARDDVAKFRSLVQNAAFVTMLVSREGTIESASAALTRLLGHDPEKIEGHRLSELFVLDDQPRLEGVLGNLARRSRPAAPFTIEANCFFHNAAAVVPVELRIVSLLDDPTVGGFVVSIQDITERAQAERELRETLSLLSATLESTADGILVVDTSGRIVSFNRRFAELWKLPEEILTARDDARAITFATEQLIEPDVFLSKVAELYATPEAQSFDTLEFLDGRVFERYSHPQKVGEEIVGRVWSFRDVTERKELEASLAHRAFHDSLTGLANKALFLQELQRAAGGNSRGRNVAMLFIDVDGLKLVNDRYGHMVGDRLLVFVADLLRARVRPGDTIARLGGDEFGVLMEDFDSREDVLSFAGQILEGLPGTFAADGTEVDVSVSVGVSFDEPGLTHLEFLNNADAAMYLAKQRGKGRVELHAD